MIFTLQYYSTSLRVKRYSEAPGQSWGILGYFRAYMS